MENQINVGDQNTPQIGQNPSNQSTQIPKRPKMKYVTIGIAILVGIALFSSGTYYFGKQSLKSATKLNQNKTIPLPTTAENDITVGWKTYNHIDNSIMFKYPEDWQVEKEGIFGSRSVTEFKYKNTTLLELTVQGNYNQITGKPYKNIDEFLGPRLNKSKETFIDGQSAKRIEDQGDPGHVIPYEEVLAFTSDKKAIVSLYYKSSYYDKPNTNRILDQILFTFKFLNNSKNTITVKLYYHDSKLDPNLDVCEANNYIEKEIPKTNTPIKDAINTLISSDVIEKDERFILKGINLKHDGSLILEFPWIGGFTTGGSCRIGILTSQIEKTTLQFPEVKKVIFEPEVFQP